MLYFLFIFLLITIFFQVFTKAMLPAYKDAKLILEEKKQELAEAHILVQELECLTKEKNELTIEQKYLLKKFQISFDAGYPFDYLGKGDLDLYINNITPYPINKTDYYSSLQVDIKITGSYLSVLNYLEKVENLPAITEIVSPTITMTEDNQVVCEFTLIIYSVDNDFKPKENVIHGLGKYDVFTPLVQALVPAESLPEPEVDFIDEEEPNILEEDLVPAFELEVEEKTQSQEETQNEEDEIYYHFPSR